MTMVYNFGNIVQCSYTATVHYEFKVNVMLYTQLWIFFLDVNKNIITGYAFVFMHIFKAY